MGNEVPFCNPCQSYHPVSQPCFDTATRPRTTTPTAGGESPIFAFDKWLMRWVADNGRKLTQTEYGIAYAAFIAAHPGEGPKAHVMNSAGGEQCAESRCVECEHNSVGADGLCTAVRIKPNVANDWKEVLCHHRCVFPAPPEAEQLKAENCKPAGDCANCGSPIVEAFAPGIGYYWYHVRGLAYCDTDNPSFDRTATPAWLAKEEINKVLTPVPAEAAAQELRSQAERNNFNVAKWHECFNRVSLTVPYSDEQPLRDEIKHAARVIDLLYEEILALRTQPSTATNSAAVEAANVSLSAYRAAIQVIEALDGWRELDTFAPEWESKEEMTTAIAMLIERYFPPAEAAIPARDDDGSMTDAQLQRARLIAESRDIDIETAQELVYLRDRVSAGSIVASMSLVAEARAFNTKIENCGINPQKAHGLIDDLISEVERPNRAKIPAEVKRLREALRAYHKIVRGWQNHVLITSRLLGCAAIDKDVEAAIDKLKHDHSTARANALDEAIEAARGEHLPGYGIIDKEQRSTDDRAYDQAVNHVVAALEALKQKQS